MKFSRVLVAATSLVPFTLGTILQNGQVRTIDYPDTTVSSIPINDSLWTTYPPSALELSYKGRWDEKHISWWSAPGLKFGFQAQQVAVSFGQYTSEGVLVAYRLDGQDWLFTNVTANSTHLLVTPGTVGYNITVPANATQSLELRITNWALGVQISGIHLSGGGKKLVRLPLAPRTMEVIGDSLSSGYTDTLEGLSSYAWGLACGFGNTEFGTTAFPGICVADAPCFGNPRGQSYQWSKTVDTSSRAVQLYGSGMMALKASRCTSRFG